jgi:2-hydroxy-3-keto-5-methylthiopentenyl-1-phosphate phosphatase
MPTADTPLRHVLVTDFDGTITRRDFFWLVVEAFAPAHLEEHWRKYTNKQITHFEALAGIFDKLPASEEAMNALLARAEPEPELKAWLARLDRAGWDVVVVSAGCSWYIERILARAGVTLPIHSNPGTFVPGGGLHMRLPTESPYFSRELGIDKAAVVRNYQKSGRVVAFAGDGFPDADAARLVPAGLRFARADLATALGAEGLAFEPFERWGDVAASLVRKDLPQSREGAKNE